MRDILKLSAELQARVSEELDSLLSERAVTRRVLESRGRELELKRDEELKRIAAWADQQRGLVMEVFSAMLAENEADIAKNDSVLLRFGGQRASDRASAALPGKAAAAFARAAE